MFFMHIATTSECSSTTRTINAIINSYINFPHILRPLININLSLSLLSPSDTITPILISKFNFNFDVNPNFKLHFFAYFPFCD